MNDNDLTNEDQWEEPNYEDWYSEHEKVYADVRSEFKTSIQNQYIDFVHEFYKSYFQHNRHLYDDTDIKSIWKVSSFAFDLMDKIIREQDFFRIDQVINEITDAVEIHIEEQKKNVDIDEDTADSWKIKTFKNEFFKDE